RSHKRVQHFAYRRRILRLNLWPIEAIPVIALKGYNDDPRTQLRHAEVWSIENTPLGQIAHFPKAVAQMVFAVPVETRFEKAADVLHHDCTRTDFINKIERSGKEITIVLQAQLLSDDRKQREM